MISAYIQAHKETFIDKRNINLIMVDGDPLGEAFGVKAFHQCQVYHLIKSQLVAVDDNHSSDAETVPLSSSNEEEFDVESSSDDEKRPAQVG